MFLSFCQKKSNLFLKTFGQSTAILISHTRQMAVFSLFQLLPKGCDERMIDFTLHVYLTVPKGLRLELLVLSRINLLLSAYISLMCLNKTCSCDCFHVCHVCMIAYSLCNLITGVSFHPNVISFPHMRKKKILSLIKIPVE